MGATVYQLYVFLCFVCIGMAAAFLCHLLSFIKPKKFRKAITLILDTVFSVLFLGAVWLFNLKFNNGEFRVYVPLGLAIGALIYIGLCKRALDKAKDSLYNLFTEKKADKKDDGQNILQ